jgi:hypothetical protein
MNGKFKNVKVGDILYYALCEFDGTDLRKCTVTHIYEDHFIMKDIDNISYWMDKDTWNTTFSNQRRSCTMDTKKIK